MVLSSCRVLAKNSNQTTHKNILSSFILLIISAIYSKVSKVSVGARFCRLNHMHLMGTCTRLRNNHNASNRSFTDFYQAILSSTDQGNFHFFTKLPKGYRFVLGRREIHVVATFTPPEYLVPLCNPCKRDSVHISLYTDKYHC